MIVPTSLVSLNPFTSPTLQNHADFGVAYATETFIVIQLDTTVKTLALAAVKSQNFPSFPLILVS